jgi:hypothetical protein
MAERADKPLLAHLDEEALRVNKRLTEPHSDSEAICLKENIKTS